MDLGARHPGIFRCFRQKKGGEVQNMKVGGRDLGTNFSSLFWEDYVDLPFFFGHEKTRKKVCCFYFHIMEGF